MNSPKVASINNRPLSKKFRRSIAEILADFSKPIPVRLVSKKPVFSRQNGKLTKTEIRKRKFALKLWMNKKESKINELTNTLFERI